jgi:hypothetical protein
MHSPVLALYESKRFLLNVDQQRLQLVLKQPQLEALTELPEIVRRYVDKLPQTPYRAVGLNYKWHAAPEGDEDPTAPLKALFVGDAARLELVTTGAEWTIGGILRWRTGDFMVKLMAEPTREPSEGIGLDFNYHRDVRGAQEAIESIVMFQESGFHARKCVKAMLGNKDDRTEPSS